MRFDRLRRDIWNWLPAFMEVADAGSVAQASKCLALTPAAVSRTLRLLEEEIGQPLFSRVGRGLALNTAGVAVRDAVREAMTAIDSGLAHTFGDPFAGILRVASLGELTEYLVLPTLIALKREHPALIPEHHNLLPARAHFMLARGELDLAFCYEKLTAEALVCERLGILTKSIYCGVGHPLFADEQVSRDDILAHPFAIPPTGDNGRTVDGWPVDIQRRVGMRITLLTSNLAVCRAGILLVVLPDVIAAPLVAAGQARRLPFDELSPIEVMVARHQKMGERSSVHEVIERVRARLRSATPRTCHR